jgi:hypothetical protein
MEIGLGETVDEEAILRRAGEVRAWIARGITVRAGDRPCEARAGEPSFVTEDRRRFVRLDIEYRCPPPVFDLVLRDDTVFPDDAQHEAIVYRVLAGEEAADVLRAGSRELELGEPPSALRVIGTFVHEGALHLATGYDHVLFLLSLLLGAGFVARRDSTRGALKDAAWLVTAFTLGHSVTLIIAALGLVVLPSRLVESVIAGSIVVVAVINLVRPDARGPMPWLAVGFGLIHGFGFSSVLAGILPRGQLVLSLVSFNVGIELAQLAFVAIALGPIALAARYRGYERWVVRGGSAVIALLAGVWLVERAFDL